MERVLLQPVNKVKKFTKFLSFYKTLVRVEAFSVGYHRNIPIQKWTKRELSHGGGNTLIICEVYLMLKGWACTYSETFFMNI